MKGRKHTPEQIVPKPREADRLLGEGQDLGAVTKQLEISEATRPLAKAVPGHDGSPQLGLPPR